MAAFRVSAVAGQRLDEIFAYTRETWGQDQAETYIRDLFEYFERIASRDLYTLPASLRILAHPLRRRGGYRHGAS
jgi:toxin ParE1/3/4